MSSQSPSTPLRDRTLTNTHVGDPHPWVQSTNSSGSQSSAISPLRIAKRDTPGRKVVATGIARRSSSSYNHVRNNNLVSKSPFRSHIPTPSKPSIPPPQAQIPRKVSGEKRPRPSSMNEQAENEHPMGFKRRQSKGLQGLYQKEPVTNSPFRRVPDRETTPEPPLPPPPKIGRQSTASPTRPSLVTKRLHGPRGVGFNLGTTKRTRRKTVTFDERCDVVEFDREEHELEDEEEEEGYHTPRDGEDDDPDGRVDADLENEPDQDVYRDSMEQEFGGSNAEDSLTGLMDSLIHDNQLGDAPCTPPHDSNFPDDLETEDGVPLGRTHHADRQAAYHEQLAREEHLDLDMPPPERSYIWSSAPSSPATPPVTRLPPSTSISTGSGLPLGRTTHSERSVTSHRRDEVDKDVQMLPPSPSPSKVSARAESRYQEGLIPSFDLPGPRRKSIPGALDPFDESPIKEDHQELPPVDVDVLPEPEPGPELDPIAEDEPLEPPPRLADISITSIATPTGSPRVGSPVLPSRASRRTSDVVHSHSGSPVSRSASPFFTNKNSSSASIESVTSLSGRSTRSPRISREDLHQRLTKKRSTDSPLREIVASDVGSKYTNVYAIDLEPTDEAGVETATLSTNMFSRKSSVEPSTDLSTDMDLREVAEEHVEKKVVASMRQHSEESAFSETSRHTPVAIEGLLPADLGFGSNGEELGDMRSALDRLVRDVAESGSGVHKPQTPPKLPFVPGNIKIEAMTEGIQAGMFQIPPTPVDDTYDGTDEGEEDEDIGEPAPQPPVADASIDEMRLEVSHDPTPLLGTGFGDFSASFGEGDGSVISDHQETPPPPPPPKIGIKEREEMIRAKRREIRRLEEEEEMRYTPKASTLTPEGSRPSRRRSKSTGDATEMISLGKQRAAKDALGMGDFDSGDDPLSESINRELQKLELPKRPQKQKYHIKERETMIIASSDADQVQHMLSAGDVNSGKAWRAVRRPSDMNEYSKQIKELRAQERTGKAHGKLFVKVMCLKSLDVPLPPQPTAMSCTLNNGIHYVTTPECELAPDTKIEQEFELIEHSKLEFTLSFKVKRDPHIVAQIKANSQPARQPAPIPREVTPPPTKSRFNFFGSPKKVAKQSPRPSPAPAPMMPPKIEENLARYLKPDGSLARAFIAYKDVAAHCDTRLFESTIPLVGQRIDPDGAGTTMTTLPVGELVLQLFRLPPLHGVPPTQLPQSLDECLRGLRHVSWHKVTYFEGTLTQNGGDCVTWKRRHFRIIGANMVAFNDVTKRAITTIDLRKAVSLHDDQEKNMRTPASHASSNSYDDEFDGPCGVERSFKLFFPGNQRISFFADTEADKAKWLEILGALVGRIPPNPLWAELLWQKQQDMAKQQPA